MRAWIRHHQLLSYFVLAYALSWAYWIPMALTGRTVAPGSSDTHLPGLLGPMLAAFLTPLLAGDVAGFRSLLRRLVRVSKPAWRFWMWSLSPLVFLVIALLIAAASGKGMPPVGDFALYSGAPPVGLAGAFALALFFNGYGEETGWRGFALPRTQVLFGPLGGTLLLALLWAGWHAPAFAIVETYRVMSPALIVFGFGLGIACGAIVLAHVSHVTGGSVLSVVVWHALYNMTSATAASRGLIGAVTTACVMVWAAILVIAELRRPRSASLLLVEPPPADSN